MNVLISGASMAGLSAAHWFARLGHEVTVVERSNGLRAGGAPIDVRGHAIGTADRMGILQQILAQRVVPGDPSPVLDGTGTQVASFDMRWFGNQTDDDVEISRDRLNQILRRSIPHGVEFHFASSIASIDDSDSGADVTLADGTQHHYDLVVGADGLHSNVRRLAFGPERDYVKHFGHYVALVDLPKDRTWQRAMLNVPGLKISVRDSGDGPQGMMIVASEEVDYDFRDIESQRRLVDRFMSRVDAWQVPQMRAAFTAPDAQGFYFDSVSQTRMPSWILGNVAVIGDAGHCAALLSGLGTTLAMVSAELMATTWTECGGKMAQANPLYHERLRPYVAHCQQFATVGAPLMVPATQEALDQRNQDLRDCAARFAETA